MARVLVLQNMLIDGPGYLGRWLSDQGHHLELRNAAAGDTFPSTLDGFDALAILGGAMSANDELPTLRQAEQLFRLALRRGVPTVGHCLGGQLMSRALGAQVTASPKPEVGWHRMSIAPAGQPWFGGRSEAVVMHWHFEAFAVPQGVGAVALASSEQCPVQAWALGPHLAMQFHVEVDAAKLALWCGERDPETEARRVGNPSIHSPERILADSRSLLSVQQGLANEVYGRWMAALSG